MKKTLFMALILSIFIIGSAGAEFRLDINVSVPIYNGIQVEGGEGVGDFSDYAFLIPDLTLSYVFDLQVIKVGAGVRMVTFIVESVLWPNAFVELDLGPVAVNASVGGGLYAYFGGISGFEATSLFIPDFSAYFKFTDLFQVGAGVVLFVGADIFGTDILPYSIYVRARFSLAL
jgi:hypothetical protein